MFGRMNDARSLALAKWSGICRRKCDQSVFLLDSSVRSWVDLLNYVEFLVRLGEHTSRMRTRGL